MNYFKYNIASGTKCLWLGYLNFAKDMREFHWIIEDVNVNALSFK